MPGVPVACPIVECRSVSRSDPPVEGPSGDVKVVKVGTHENIADGLTKYVSKNIMDMHINITKQRPREGRHALAPATEY